MRVRIEGKKLVVRLMHFRFCSKHVALLSTLQVETPSLPLTVEGPSGFPMAVLVADLNLDPTELQFLNPDT